MTLSRRDFTKITAASIAVAALPVSALAETDPGVSPYYTHILYGDGIHCDADALSALINGDVEVAVSAAKLETWFSRPWLGDTLTISGTFLIKKPIHITKAFNGKTLSGPATIKLSSPSFWGEAISFDKDVENVTLNKITSALNPLSRRAIQAGNRTFRPKQQQQANRNT